MMVTAKIASEGQKAMRKLMEKSVAKQIFWPMTAGRYHEKAPGLIEAVNYAGTAAAKFYAAVKASGLRVKDANYQLVAVSDNTFTGFGAWGGTSRGKRCDSMMNTISETAPIAKIAPANHLTRRLRNAIRESIGSNSLPTTSSSLRLIASSGS